MLFIGQDDNVGGSPSHSSRSKYGGSTGGSGASIAPVLGPGPVEEARRAFQVPVRRPCSVCRWTFFAILRIPYRWRRACIVDGQKRVAMP